MSEKKEKYTAVVLAAGKGTRMGGSVAKQFLEIGGKPVVVYALEVFEHSPEIDQIILVTGADKIEYCQKEIIEKYGIKKTVSVCAGGRERYESVWKALQTLKSLESEQDQKTDYVLIHDGARPFLNQEMLERLCACVKEEKACVLGMPVKDTIKLTDENGKATVPPTNVDYTDVNGYSEVDGYIVTVINETGAIKKAFITLNTAQSEPDSEGNTQEIKSISVQLPENIKVANCNSNLQ